MKTYVHLWWKFAEFVLHWDMFQTTAVEKIKVNVLCSRTFVPKILPLWDNMEKYGTAREDTDGNKIRRIKDVICLRDN
jgi:hypothetical protein